jgi:hypothetical protein
MKDARVIKQMWSGDKTRLITWSHLFYYLITLVLLHEHLSLHLDQTSIITWSNLFYYLIRLVLLFEHLSIPLDQTCFITWSNLFYYPSTFHYHLITFVLSPDHICFITWEHLPSITSWSNLFDQLITLVIKLDLFPDQIFFLTRSLIKR